MDKILRSNQEYTFTEKNTVILPTEVKKISSCQQFVEFHLQYVESISNTRSNKSSTIFLYCSITDKENIHIPRTEGLEIPSGGGGGRGGISRKCMNVLSQIGFP